MQRLLALLVTALGLAALRPASALAWSGEGHKLVCEIAWRRLTPAAQQFVRRVRTDDPDAGPSFASTCAWADGVRNTTHKGTYNYHFINIPAKSAPDMARDCGDAEKRCAPWAIRHYADVLRDRNAAPLERAEALKFLAHFVGDLHQPLHAGRPEDRGGNSIKLSLYGKLWRPPTDSFTLHGIWDEDLIERAGLRWPESARTLSQAIAPSQTAAWSNARVLAWTSESYRLCEDFVYPAVPASRDVRDAYFLRASREARQQLQKAGVRLAYVLNGIAAGTLKWPEAWPS
jgi:nuclease S1